MEKRKRQAVHGRRGPTGGFPGLPTPPPRPHRSPEAGAGRGAPGEGSVTCAGKPARPAAERHDAPCKAGGERGWFGSAPAGGGRSPHLLFGPLRLLLRSTGVLLPPSLRRPPSRGGHGGGAPAGGACGLGSRIIPPPPGAASRSAGRAAGRRGRAGGAAACPQPRLGGQLGPAAGPGPLHAQRRYTRRRAAWHSGLIFRFCFLLSPLSFHRLVHLAIIHCVPAVALCCIAQLPREVLEIQNDLFQTPLHLAVYLEQPHVIQALIHKGVNPGLQDRNGNTPLHLACEQQHLQCAQQLLGSTAPPEGTAQPHRHHQDLQLQNWQGLACLHISTLKGNIPMMSLLLESGANIDVREGTSGKTPLHLAVECHNRKAVQFLLRNGAYVDAQMYNGCTPLHLAVGRKDAAIAAILSHSGADTLLRNMENETAQDLADGNDDLLALLPFDDLKISGKPVVCSE
ncbi:NF-kappa-B inhibitor epsilon [Manacus vitellinus]|uniref:NF-kappa-B inhibitor epsilon n=1 Tax=Manacus vitellinus TaxID=328815 RepID=UPI00115EAD05|nr:NF-kappa-B inhibitor epsilon [Manacus vitellinus]